VASSGVVEYSLDGGEDGSSAAGAEGAEAAPRLARLPFTTQDIASGSGALRPGDHVTFRILTNLQVGLALATSSVQLRRGRHPPQNLHLRTCLPC
jgi:hypothetical protein